MPSFPVIDTHVHLYDPAWLRYSWLDGLPAINRPFGMAELDAHRGAVELEGLVFVEVAVDPGLHLAEAAWAQAAADADGRIKGLVAHAPVEKGAAVDADLDRLGRNRSLRGIRRLIEREYDAGICLEPDFVEGVRRVGRRGLVFDICVKHWQLVFVNELVRRCPDVPFVLDHIGKPGIRHGFTEPWKSQIAELARAPNVTCKLSGVVTEADHRSWAPEQLRPYIDHVIEVFGFERVMYGSDWTVGLLTHGYPRWVAILDEVTAGCSEAERQRLFRDNAIRTYRL